MMELTDEQLWEIVNCDVDGWSQEKGTQHIVEQSRWLTTSAAVFTHAPSGRHIEIAWDRPSTEVQDGSPCEISHCDIEQKEVTELRWVPVATAPT